MKLYCSTKTIMLLKNEVILVIVQKWSHVVEKLCHIVENLIVWPPPHSYHPKGGLIGIYIYINISEVI